MCKFLHIRNYVETLTGVGSDTESVADGKGGKTVAFEVDDKEGVIFFAVARCGPKYNFNRRLGRIVSKGMLECKRKASMERHVCAIGFTPGTDNPYEVLRNHLED
jgi:hypothetical protein